MKKIISILIFFILIIIILFNSIDIMESIKFSFSLCINNLFPALIPFMILSNILIKYNFIYELSNMFKLLMEKVFKVSKNCAFAFILSIISGTPSNSKYLKDLYDFKLISESDLKNCLNFCHFTNPIFILGTIGYNFLNSKKIGLIILVSHYLASIIIGINNKKILNDIKLEKNIKKNNKEGFINILTNSIIDTINTLLLILGIITTCLIITSILNNILNINDNFKFLYGLIEISQGLKYLSISNIDILYKACISSFIISFGGFCIHAQVFSILNNKKIRYMPYFKSRLVHGILSFIITYIIMKFN